MNASYERIRELIIDTYTNFKLTPRNFLYAITHFRDICRFAMIGIKITIVYGINLEYLKKERKHRGGKNAT